MQASAVTSWGVTYPRTNPWYMRLFPSLTDVAFLLPAFLVFAKMGGAGALLADGDTGWHIRTGEWILQHKAVPRLDLFSFTKAGQPWFAWEWGWDATFAFVHAHAGLAGVVFINLVLLCVVSLLLFRLIRRCCQNDVLAIVFTMIAMCASTIHWLARPHLFSWLFALIFAHLILSAEQGNLKKLRWLPLLTILWTNLHGGFFVGIILLLTSALGQVADAVIRPERLQWRPAVCKPLPFLTCAALCMAATFVNPYTWHLHQHIVSYLRDAKLLDTIQEFQSVSFHDGASIFFELLLLMSAAALPWCFRNRQFAAGLSVILWAHLALVSARNIPLFAFIAAPWIAAMLARWPDYLRQTGWLNRFQTAVSEICNEFSSFERIERVYACSGFSVVLMALLFAAPVRSFNPQFEAKQFPVKSIAALERAHPARIFTYDQWGDYLIYRLYPSTRVFIDGRSDFYGDKLVDTYLNVVNARYDWQENLKRYGVDTVLIKPNAPIATVLKMSPGWELLFDDGSAIIFQTKSVSNGQKEAALRRLELTGSNSTVTTHERRS